MQFDVWSKALPDLAVDCIAAGVFEDGKLGTETTALDKATAGRIKNVVSRGDFSGRSGETLLMSEAGLKATRVILVGLGAERSYNRKVWRRACTAALSAAARTRIRSVALGIERPAAKELDDYYFGRCVAEITGNVLYRTNDLKTGKKPPAPVINQVLAGPVRATGVAQAKQGLEHGRALAEATSLQRDLGNLPPNICTPGYLADRARGLAKRYASVKVKVLDEAAIRREKMGCFLAVTQGSAEPPRFIVLDYRGPRASRTAPIVLVGKGITFDTGGISLKDPGAMDEMKYDMMGAASVMGAIAFLAEAKLPVRVVGLVAACENMPDGRAVKPADIVTSASGQTVEILNTDAEGRLILADAITRAAEDEPDRLIELSTLTGAQLVSLGTRVIGAMGEPGWRDEVVAAGTAAGEASWAMPMPDELRRGLDSSVADIKNVPTERFGGMIVAGRFLGEFVPDGLPWVHLDIAGPAFNTGSAHDYTPVGGTGAGVRTVIAAVEGLAARS